MATRKMKATKAATEREAGDSSYRIGNREVTFAGTYVSTDEINSGQVFTESWDPKARYRWSAGVAISKFLYGLKAGKIVGIHCGKCDRTVTPPRAFCEVCLGPISKYVELPKTGTINTFTVCYIDVAARRIDTPVIPIVVDIDGTKPSGGFLHHLGEVTAKKGKRSVVVVDAKGREVDIGRRVEAVWKPVAEREALITDIKYFRPV
ncbi:MAG TPA: Zn-ribbon domain-containing OB-fold protein [Thermoplasmata archaeon]|nr:Zn-ribbon domain-containing OB-fold protein [Thermoplasmata archaeon]